MVISLGRKKNKSGEVLEVALNINYLPRTVRRYFVDKIFQSYKAGIISASKGNLSNRAAEQSTVPIDYYKIKKFLAVYGLGFAIRTYYPQRKRKIGVICYEEWRKGIWMEPVGEQFFGTTPRKILSSYKEGMLK